MGWAERANPNSLWNKKRGNFIQPIIQVEKPPEIIIQRKTTFWNRFIVWIKKLFHKKGGK